MVLAEGADRGTTFFHAVQPDLERQNLWNLEDKNGLLIVQELIANAGKNFVEYYFDNPDVIGDEDEGSLKVSWGEELTIMGRKFIILSGFYPATAVPVAPPLAQLLLAVILTAGGACLPPTHGEVACCPGDFIVWETPAWHCQVDEKVVDRPPIYWAPARREPAMLGIRNGRQPQLDNTRALRRPSAGTISATAAIRELRAHEIRAK